MPTANVAIKYSPKVSFLILSAWMLRRPTTCKNSSGGMERAISKRSGRGMGGNNRLASNKRRTLKQHVPLFEIALQLFEARNSKVQGHLPLFKTKNTSLATL